MVSLTSIIVTTLAVLSSAVSAASAGPDCFAIRTSRGYVQQYNGAFRLVQDLRSSSGLSVSWGGLQQGYQRVYYYRPQQQISNEPYYRPVSRGGSNNGNLIVHPRGNGLGGVSVVWAPGRNNLRFVDFQGRPTGVWLCPGSEGGQWLSIGAFVTQSGCSSLGSTFQVERVGTSLCPQLGR